MYTLNEFNMQLNEQHRREMMQQAENQRLARQAAQQGQPDTNIAYGLYAPLLAGLGRQLAEFGQHLQETYETPAGLHEA